ncbi:hypothetical protein [Burkholderia ubonensis]|nr:hypothetical protein [Burkholderia ubonensis]
MNIQVFMMDDCATQGYGRVIPDLNETLLDVWALERVRRRRHDCPAKSYAPTL